MFPKCFQKCLPELCGGDIADEAADVISCRKIEDSVEGSPDTTTVVSREGTDEGFRILVVEIVDQHVFFIFSARVGVRVRVCA